MVRIPLRKLLLLRRYGQCFKPQFIPCILIILIRPSIGLYGHAHFSKFHPFSLSFLHLMHKYEGLNGLCTNARRRCGMRFIECTTFQTQNAGENSSHKYSFHMSASTSLITFSFCCSVTIIRNYVFKSHTV